MRALYLAAVDSQRTLSDEALAASLDATLARRPRAADWWVFAYGSLLWNPLFPFTEARPAQLRGLHRRFCLWSLASRGSTQTPGLVFGLDRGGACLGVAYRLPAPCARAELALLWRREMVVGSYRPRWLSVHASGRRLTALAFVVDRSHPQYTGKLSLARQAKVHRVRRLRFIGRLSRTCACRADHARYRRPVFRSARRARRSLPSPRRRRAATDERGR